MEEECALRKVVVEEAIAKAKKILEGDMNVQFSTEEYQRFHLCAYELAASKEYGGAPAWLYERFCSSLRESILSLVLPSLVTKTDGELLRELILMWSNYKSMTKWVCRFFEYLDRHYISERTKFRSLSDISVSLFNDVVFGQLYVNFQDAAISMINQERKGSYIDRDLLKNAIIVFIEVYNHKGSYYEEFEQALLSETATYYSYLAPLWLSSVSLKDYIQQFIWCLNQEEERASYYLSPDTKCKLLKVVKFEMLERVMDRLEEKHKAENCGMITDYQDMLSKCASMSLTEGSATPAVGDWLSALLASATHMS